MRDANPELDPGPILQTSFALWSSNFLLTAVEFGLFTKLGDRRIEALAAKFDFSRVNAL